MKHLAILSVLLLFIFQLFCAAAVAEEYPAGSQAALRADEIAAEAIKVRERLAMLLDTADLKAQLDLAAADFRELQLRVESFDDPGLWHIERLLDTQRQLLRERKQQLALAQSLTVRQEEVEGIRLDWAARQQFWRGWKKHLAGEKVPWPGEVFKQAQEDIRQVLLSATTATEHLAQLQGEQATVLNESLGLLDRVETALRQARAQLFQRSGVPLLGPEFFEHFNEELNGEFHSGLQTALSLDLRELHGQIWILVLQVLLVFVTATFIRRHRRPADENREWNFIVNHPWATGIFASMAALSPLYAAPPVLWRLAEWALFAFSAAVLISGLVRNPLKRFTVFLLATVLLVSLVLQLINLPTPLYRIYVTGVALTGLLLALLLARYNIARHQGRVTLFSMGLRFAALVSLVIILAQLAGFDTLAARLFDASIKSIFIGIFAMMTIRLGKGAIDYFLSRPLLARRAFVQHCGQELARRLKGILLLLVIVGALFNILFVLGVYDSLTHALEALASLGISVGQVQLTVPMLLMALLVIYLSIQASWVLQATLETQVFPYSSVDRGVRDAVKKLLHYFLIFLGFLLAMGLAGIELRNFAVLAGAFGIGIGFGLQNIVNNFVSGLILLFERPVKVGDQVVVDEDWGRVISIGLRSTVIETFDGSELIVPNSLLISEKVTNWTLSTTKARIVLPVGVAYGSDLEAVLRILKEAAESHPLTLSQPPPSPIFVGFGDSSLDFELRCWIADVDKRLDVRSDLGRFIDGRFREGGVEIPFPQRDLHLRSVDGEILGRVQPEPTKDGASPHPINS